VIVLTGASGGIGSAILSRLAMLDRVVALYRTKPPSTAESPQIVPYQVNLTEETSIRRCAAWIRSEFGRITFVHAAAVSRDGLAAQYNTDDWDHVMAVNLRAAFLMTRELIPPMIGEKWGRIIYCSSVAASRGEKGTVAYSASKAGLAGLSRVLAHEYGRFGITSNVLTLGYFETGLIEELPESRKRKIVGEIPSRKLGSTDNVVRAVEYLIESPYTNGAEINVDGGI